MESEWKWENGEWVNGIEVTGLGERALSYIPVIQDIYGSYSTCGVIRPHGYIPQPQTFIGIPPRWTCVYCKSSLSSDRDKCPNCGGPRHEANA